MFKEIIELIKKEQLVSKGDRIVVGFSGGADSVFLLILLLELQKDISFELQCCHINHSLRGNEALRDEEFVRDFCMKRGIRLYRFRIDVNAFAQNQKISTEEAGRVLRYDRFNKIAKDEGKIAVAHHKDDQVETILMNILRGSALSGLVGMKWRNNNVIRPLLGVSKLEILSFLEDNNIDYCTDSTNKENIYQRNRIRNLLIPELEKEYNPNFKESMIRMSKALSRDQDYLEELTQKKFDESFKREEDYYFILEKEWNDLHAAIKYRFVLKVIDVLLGARKNIGQVHLDGIVDLLDHEEGRKYILEDYIFTKDSHGIWIYKERKKEDTEKKIIIGKEILFNGYIIKAEKKPVDQLKFGKNKAYFSTDILQYSWSLRYRKNGDRFTPFGKGGEKKLKDFFIDEKIPQFKRNRIPLLICDDDIIWIPRIRRSQLYIVRESDEESIEFTWRKK